MKTLTLTGSDALAVKYAIELVRVKYPQFSEMSDDEILSRLIDIGREATKKERDPA